MSVDELLDVVRRQNVSLWVEDNRLRYRTTTPALGPELLQQLRAHRVEIISRLSTATEDVPAARPPLGFAQQGLWLLDQLEPNRPTYNLPAALEFCGALDVPVLERALNEILRRHEALRTTVAVSDDGEPFQVIAPAHPRPLPVVDVSRLPDGQRQSEAERLMDHEANRPFDLAAGPLARYQLLRLQERQHILLWNAHHSVFDGRSMSVLVRELSELYTAFVAGRPSPLPELPIQFADFARWQRKWLQGEVLARQLEYWKQQLAGASFLLELPTDRPRPPMQSYAGDTLPVELSRALTGQLKELSGREGTTLFMTLLAAFQTFLHRYSGQTDLLVASPIAGRDHVGTEGLIGFFVNTLVVRGNMADNPTFRELLRRVRETTLGAFAHHDVPFEKLVEEVRPVRDMSRAPLCQVMFVLQDLPPLAVELPGLKVTVTPLAPHAAQYDLTLELTETPDGLRGHMEYCTDLFTEARMQRMIGHFQTLLAGIVAAPGQPLGQLPLLTEAERHQMLVEWNNMARPYPTQKCLHQLFAAQAARKPDTVAVEFEDRRLTYRELDQRTNQLAHHLIAVGVKTESFVGICMERSLEMIVGLLGVLKAGAAYVPMDPDYPADRLAFMLSDANPPVLLTQASLRDKLPPYPGRVICLDADWPSVARQSSTTPATGVTPENLSYMIYTSGSTGLPKGVMISHRAIVNHMFWILETFPMDESDVVLLKTALSFDPSIWEIFAPLLVDARLLVARPGGHQDPAYLARVIQERGVTSIQVVPSELRMLLEEPSFAACRGLRHVFCGGEELTSELARRFVETLPAELHNLYGPTETTIDSLYYTVPRRAVPAVIPIGHPVANTQVYVLDDHRQPVLPGVAGELFIGGVEVGRGYHNQPQLTAERFLDDFFCPAPGARLYRTGDLVRHRSDGLLEFLGRVDHQVKIRGFRIELGEVEAALRQVPAVDNAVVIAREDTPGDKRLVAYLTTNHGHAPAADELRRQIQKNLPDYMVPAAFIPLEYFPLMPNGKVDRHALPAPVYGRNGSNDKHLAPRDPLETQLTRIWQGIFRITPIGIRDNFFELGGHSLLAVRLFAQVEKLTGKRLPMVTLFQTPTIEQLAQILKQEGWQPPWQCLVPIKAGGSQAPFYCIHGAGGNILEYLDLAKYMDPDRPFYGIQALGLDGKRSRQTLTVEEMAAHYIEEIRALQTTGPYYLGGSSFGGTVAYEMAQQLRAAGETVGLLALFDTNAPGYPRYLPTATVWQRMLDRFHHRVSLHWENFRAAQGKERLAYLRVKTKKWCHAIVAGSLRKLWRVWLRLRAHVERLCLPAAIRQVQRVGHWAASDYQPAPYDGDVTLFRAIEQPRHIIEDRTLGWSPLVRGSLTIYDTPGHHGAIVRDPRAQALAQQLTEALQKAQANGNHSENP